MKRTIRILDSEVKWLDLLWMIAQGVVVVFVGWCFFVAMALLGTAAQ